VVAVCLAEIIDVTCKMAFEDKQTSELTAENTTPPIDIEPVLKITFHSGVRINF
jgi:hypothetical protein